MDIHPESHGNGDLVAHFFRRAYTLIRRNGCISLIATNTIGQGDTRTTELRWICLNGGTIYAARRRLKWPGQAAVIVSVVWAAKNSLSGPYDLDGRAVPKITAYLFHAGGNDNPEKIRANFRRSFVGTKTTGMGFTFDDSDTRRVATPIADMQRLIDDVPRNVERIFPFLGGEELNDSPTQSCSRYIINFGEMTEAEARRRPALMDIVESKVRPEREAQNREIRRRYWWRFGEPTPALYEAISRLSRVLVVSRVGQHGSLAFVTSKWVYSESLVVIAFASDSAFCTLQSRPHEVWARFFASSMKDDMRYTPFDCFETYPFPKEFESNPSLESAGRAYYEFRAALMVRNNEGLTKTYNRFHDPDERSPDILKLRELHAAMDRAVLDAYGWTDLKPICEFLLDYEEDEHEDETGGTRRRKKPWRYRWPDDFRDEVLARLLELSRQRAEQERLSGAAESGRGKSTKKSTKGRKADTKKPDQPEFFES